MATRTLVTYSDFICPFCYIAKINLERLQKREPDVEIEWREFELHPEGQPDPHSAYMHQARANVERLALNYQIDMRPEVLTELTSDSRKALLGLVFAREEGNEQPYRDAVFEAYWVQGHDIGDMEVLTNIAGQVGLDQARFRDAVERETHRPTLEATQNEARRRGVQGVPTYVYGDEVSMGAQPLDMLQRWLAHASDQDAKGSACEVDDS